MGEITDEYRLKLSGNLAGQTVNNIFYYRQGATSGDAGDVINLFVLNIIPKLQAALSTAMTFTDIECINVEDGSDFESVSGSWAGSQAGDYYDTFGAFGFILYPRKANMKSGAKRFAGVPELSVASGVPTATQLVKLDDLATAIGGNLGTALSGTVFYPAFYSRRCIKNVDKKCTSAYTESYELFNGSAFKWTTTQNSRKRGVGV